MSMFHNLFTWESREPKLNQCYFKNCKTCVPMANKGVNECIDLIIQDYQKCILIVKTFEGVTHIPYSVSIENLAPRIIHPDRVTQVLVERLDNLEQRIEKLEHK